MGNTHSQQLKKHRNMSSSTKHHVFTKETAKQVTERASDDYRNSTLTAASKVTSSPTLPSLHPHATTLSLPPSPTFSQPSYCTIKSADAIIIQGRKYQNVNTKYILPADDQEQDRLVQCHFIYKYLFGSNFSAPVQDLLSGPYQDKSSTKKRNSSSSWDSPRVLDIACGNGTWILEMATEYPDTQFYGIDFYPNYPMTIKPTNTWFSQHDILCPRGLPFPDNYFDYIFMRQVYTCFSESDWILVMKEIKRLVKQGGYVEFRDIDPILKNAGPHTCQLFRKYPEDMKKKQGVDITWARHMADYLQDFGEMTDMHRQMSKLRFGLSGPVGNMIDNSLRSGLESYRLFFQKYNKFSPEEYTQIIDDVVEESCRLGTYFNYYCCWGRKPLLDYDFTASRKNSHTTASSSVITPPVVSNEEDDEKDAPKEDNLLHPPHRNSQYHHLEVENLNNTFSSLGTDDVSDIDQFIEGFEE